MLVAQWRASRPVIKTFNAKLFFLLPCLGYKQRRFTCNDTECFLKFDRWRWFGLSARDVAASHRNGLCDQPGPITEGSVFPTKKPRKAKTKRRPPDPVEAYFKRLDELGPLPERQQPPIPPGPDLDKAWGLGKKRRKPR